MAVPDFQSFFKPLLEIAADGREHSLREARDRIAKEMGLSQADLGEKLPSGTQTKFGRYPRAHARGTWDQNPKSSWSFSWPLSTFSWNST